MIANHDGNRTSRPKPVFDHFSATHVHDTVVGFDDRHDDIRGRSRKLLLRVRAENLSPTRVARRDAGELRLLFRSAHRARPR